MMKFNAEAGSQADKLKIYLTELEKESGVHPRGFWFPEKVQKYIQRALNVAEAKKRS
jgi:hypothetical protein